MAYSIPANDSRFVEDFERYKTPTTDIVREATRGGSAGATGSAVSAKAPETEPSPSPSTSPVYRTHVTRGGAIQPGLSVGGQVRRKGPGRQLRLYLYADGEYMVCDQNDKEREFGDGNFHYDSLYAVPSKRPSPNEARVAKGRAKAEAKRYKLVIAPGKGIPSSHIATVLHNYHVQLYSAGVNGMGTNVTDDAYLLLTDGTVYNGLPVAPDQMDVALWRQKEPQKWGHWRREGGQYVAQWSGRKGAIRSTETR